MFDPTAFDNVKVVLEGAIYDLDLDGKLCVTDRNDIVNVAKLSRQLELTVKKEKESKVSCTIVLRADLMNLAAELHPLLHSEKEAGCHFQMIFTIGEQPSFYVRPLEVLQAIWGKDREYICKVSHDPFNEESGKRVDIDVHFKRLIYEDQIEDLTALAEYVLHSLEDLEQFLK